jgi:hypothetical protein
MENLDSFRITSEHENHLDADKILKTDLVDTVKAKMLSSNDSPRELVYISIRGSDLWALLIYFLRRLRDHRPKTINPEPYYNALLGLSLSLNMTHLGEEFFRYIPENYQDLEINDNVLLFFSDTMLHKPRENNVWADGTFSVVPDPYYQLYTVSYIKNNHLFPVIFAILKNKLSETYLALFRIIKTFLGDFSPYESILTFRRLLLWH